MFCLSKETLDEILDRFPGAKLKLKAMVLRRRLKQLHAAFNAVDREQSGSIPIGSVHEMLEAMHLQLTAEDEDVLVELARHLRKRKVGRVCVVQPANPPEDPCPYESCMTGAPDHYYVN